MNCLSSSSPSKSYLLIKDNSLIRIENPVSRRQPLNTSDLSPAGPSLAHFSFLCFYSGEQSVAYHLSCFLY